MSDHAHSHHVTSMPVLLATFAALVGFTILTVFVASMDLGRLDMVITLLIATAKAALVALIFMQLAHDKPFNGIILVSALLFVGLFLGFVLMDSDAYQQEIEDYTLTHPKTADSP